jgi:LysM repeat protein
MNYWYKKGLAKRDKVHLTTMGYYVRGELFLNALLNSYELYLKRSNNDSLISDKIIIDTIQLKKYFAEDISFKSEIRKKEQIVEYSEPEQNGDDTDKIFYTIRSGDNLGSIAEKFGISVRNLQLWNGINGTKIIAGETLVIYKKNPPKPEPKQVKPAEKTTNIPVPVANTNDKKSPRKAAHKVVSGETLWIIANKYNTTVEKLKKQNNLVSDKLKIGQILYIP